MTQYFRFQKTSLAGRNRHPLDFEREREVLSRFCAQTGKVFPPVCTSLEAGCLSPFFSALLG
jgi:ribosomal protein S18